MQKPDVPENESQRLQALYALEVLDSPCEERFDRLTRLAQFMFDVPIAVISLVDANRQWFKSHQGLSVCETGRDISFCGHAILQQQVFEVPDSLLDIRFADNPLVVAGPKIRFYAGVPLVSKGYNIGMLCIKDTKPRQLSAPQKQALLDLALVVSTEFNSIQLHKLNQDLLDAQQLSLVIARAQQQFISENDRRQAFDHLLADLLKLTASEYGFLGEVLFNSEGKPYLKTYAITNIAWNDATRAFYAANAPKGMEFTNLQTLFGAALTTGQPVIANNPSIDSRRGGLPQGHPAMHGFLGVPIHHGGKMVAMLGVANRAGGYDQSLIDYLSPLLVTIGQLVVAAQVQLRYAENQQLLRHQLQAFAALNEIAATASLETHEQVTRALQLGAAHLRLDCGIVSEITLNEYEIQAIAAPAGLPLYCGQRFALGDTYCDLTFKQNDVVAVTQMSDSEFRGHACYQVFKLECYIGIALEIAGQRFGTLCFSSATARNDAFSDGDILFIRLLARWIAAVLERQQSAQALTTSELRLRSLFELSPIGIALNDFDTGAFIDINEALVQPSGYGMEEFKQLSYWELTPKDYLEQEKLQRVAIEKTGRYGPYEKEYLRKDGTRYPVLINGMVVKDHNGQKLIWSIVEDMSERKRLMRMQNEFISTVSHELRTPLTSISGSVGLLASGAIKDLPDPAKDILKIAARNCQRLELLINDLLDMEKLLSGKMDFVMQLCELNQQLLEAQKVNQSYAEQFNVTLVLQPFNGPVWVQVDERRLQQVFANLLSNAAKFSPTGAEVLLYTEVQNDSVRVCVCDQGLGVPAAFKERIFQKFEQADASDTRQKGGSGLGLAISRELMIKMKGQIGFDSVEGEGATFYIDLPRFDNQDVHKNNS